MIKSKIKKLYYRSCAFIVLSLFLLGGCPGIIEETVINISAAGAGVTFGNTIVTVIPMATCSNTYTSSACINCNMGSWDDITLLAKFGAEDVVATYACKMASFKPSGGGLCQIGEVIMGPAAANQLSANDGQTTNVWCQMQ